MITGYETLSNSTQIGLSALSTLGGGGRRVEDFSALRLRPPTLLQNGGVSIPCMIDLIPIDLSTTQVLQNMVDGR